MYKDSHFGGGVIADRQQQPVSWKRTSEINSRRDIYSNTRQPLK